MDRIKALHAQRYKFQLIDAQPVIRSVESVIRMGSKVTDLFNYYTTKIDTPKEFDLGNISKPGCGDGKTNSFSFEDMVPHLKVFCEKNKDIKNYEQFIIRLDSYDILSEEIRLRASSLIAPVFLTFIIALCSFPTDTQEQRDNLRFILRMLYKEQASKKSTIDVMILRMLAGFYKNGRNIFYMTPGLTEMLIETDSIFDDNLLNLPFDCFYVALNMPFKIRDGLSTQAQSDIEGFYIRKSHGRNIQIIIVVTNKNDSSGDTYIEQYLNIDNPNFLSFSDQPKEVKSAIKNAVINSVIYINCIKEKRIEVPSVIMSVSKKTKKIEKSKKTCLDRYVILGSEYATTGGSGTGSGWRLHNKTWVRGHFRNQPSGSRLSPVYNLIWIKPFIKGKNFENEINKTYLVDEITG